MTTRLGLLAFLCVVALLPSHAAGVRVARTAGVRLEPGDPADIVPGVVIVKLRHGLTMESRLMKRGSPTLGGEMTALGVRGVRPVFLHLRAVTDEEAAAGRVDLSTVYELTIDPGANPQVAAQQLGDLDGVEYAEPRYVCHLTDIPNDSDYVNRQQPYYVTMRAQEGWSVTRGDTNVTIAVVDGGTSWRHRDLIGNLWVNKAEDVNHSGAYEPGAPPGGDQDSIDNDGNGYVDDVIGWNLGNSSGDPTGFDITPISRNHGTATASIAGAATNNSIGMAGAGWRCRVMPVNASSATNDNDVAYGFEGIEYAARSGASIINCSWGRQGYYSRFEQDVITAATQAGSLVVAAAGNNNSNNDYAPFYPASYDHVLAVGATSGASDVKWAFSNYGVTIPLYAPGSGIWVALSSGGFGSGQGTSFSSPITAGLAGLVRSLHPTWTPAQIAAQLRVTSDSIDAVNGSRAGLMGRGRINFVRALTESHSGVSIVADSISTPSGRREFLPGDTVVVRLAVRSEIAAATNVVLTMTSSTPSLKPLNNTVTIPSIGAQQTTSLPDLLFLVDTLSASRQVLLKAAWSVAGNEHDVAGFRLYVFPASPAWELQDSPSLSTLTSVKAVDRSVAWAAGGNGAASATIVIRTVDGGDVWEDVTGNLPGLDLYCVAAIDSQHAWVGSGDGRIYSTVNGGASWAQQPYPGTQSPFIDGIWFFDPLNGVALGDPNTDRKYVILQTTDGGSTWLHTAGEPTGGAGEAGLNNSFWWTDRNHGWFGSNYGKAYRTTDGGGTWTWANSGSANSIAISFGDSLRGLVSHDDGVIRQTTDGGQNWLAVTSPTVLPIRGISFIPLSSKVWIVSDSGPFASTNGGAAWVAEAVYPIQGTLVGVSFADSIRGWAVTSVGEIVRHRASDTNVVQPPVTLPTTYSLYQNFPNPFNGSTTILYDLPVAAHVEVKLYDILGREVRTMTSGSQRAGTQRASLEANGLASGVYFYRVVAVPENPNNPSYTGTGKMVIIR